MTNNAKTLLRAIYDKYKEQCNNPACSNPKYIQRLDVCFPGGTAKELLEKLQSNGYIVRGSVFGSIHQKSVEVDISEKGIEYFETESEN